MSPVSPVAPDNMAPPSAVMNAGPTQGQRKLIHRKSTLSLHLSSFLHHTTPSGGKEKGIQEPTVVQLPPTPDFKTTPTIVSSSDDTTDRESSGGISTANTSVAGSRSSSINSKTATGLTVSTPATEVDQGSQERKKERRKSRLSMLIPSFFSSDADQQGITGTSVSAEKGTKLHKQQRPVTANPLLSMAPVTAANYANPGAQQATTSAKSTVRVTGTDHANGTTTIRPSTSVNVSHNSNLYYDPAANYSTSTNSSPPLSQTGEFSLSRSIFLSLFHTYLLTLNLLEPHQVRASTMPLEKTNPSTSSPGPAARPGTGSRSVSVEGPPPGVAIPPNRLQKQQQQQQQQDYQQQQQQPPRNSSPASSTGHSRSRSTSSQPPAAEPPRIVSTSADSRPTSTHSNGSDDSSPITQKQKQRRSWFGGRSRSNSEVNKGDSNAAWIVAPDSKADYSTANLMNGEKV